MTEVTSRLKASRPVALFGALLLTGALAFASSAGGAQGAGNPEIAASTAASQLTLASRVAGQLVYQPHGPGSGHGSPMGMGHGMAGQDSSSIDGAVPFDKAFIAEMIPHHQMAVMMSTMALRHVDRPELQGLLRSIVESQSAEIAQMRSWYQAWYGTPLPSMGAPAMGGPGGPGAPIQGLAPEEVRQIWAGQGAGLARAAELNGLPGPGHVLDLAEELGLSPQQRAQIQAVFAAMQDEAARVGQPYLDAQQSFEHGLRDPAQRGLALGARHTVMTELRGELERVHLRAHLVTAKLLTEFQIATYNSLRGYESAD